MRWIMVCLAAVFMIACTEKPEGAAGAASSAAGDCLSAQTLRAQSEVFVDPQDWAALPQLRDWSALRAQKRSTMQTRIDAGASGIDAVALQQNDIVGALSWHEGFSVCVQQRADGYWARQAEGENLAARPWEGPFVPVPGARAASVAYFNRLFGQTCFQDEQHQRWCFSSGTLQIGSLSYAAELQLDESEMPGYGSAVKLEQKKGFLIFVPADDGWKVYRDDFVTVPGHVEINPKRDAPWRTLRPFANPYY